MAGPGALPSGIVTFVLTDIEGSTRHLRRLGNDYSPLLDRHLELMQEAWDAHGGHVIDTAGDGVFVAFQDADDAVNACADAQRRLCAEPWPAGAADPGSDGRPHRPGGPDRRRLPRPGRPPGGKGHVVRARSAGVGLRRRRWTAWRASMPKTMVVPLGRFRVRDFDEPVRLFQLAGEGLPSEFPAVRAVPADGHNLVAPATTFIGRDDEIAELASRLGPGRLVTLAGPGGVGKTRLATEVGLRVAEQWPDGAWLVDLSSLDHPSCYRSWSPRRSACPAAARTDGRRSSIISRDKQALIMFDNCESAVADSARLLEELLARCPACGVAGDQPGAARYATRGPLARRAARGHGLRRRAAAPPSTSSSTGSRRDRRADIEAPERRTGRRRGLPPSRWPPARPRARRRPHGRDLAAGAARRAPRPVPGAAEQRPDGAGAPADAGGAARLERPLAPPGGAHLPAAPRRVRRHLLGRGGHGCRCGR